MTDDFRLEACFKRLAIGPGSGSGGLARRFRGTRFSFFRGRETREGRGGAQRLAFAEVVVLLVCS